MANNRMWPVCRGCGKKETSYIRMDIKNNTISEIAKPQTMTETFDIAPMIFEIKCPRCGEMNTNKKESAENVDKQG
jgi:uncharacterized UBP type Zn finger protein